MRRRKRLAWIGVVSLVIAIVACLAAFAPTQKTGFEPEWLLKIKPTFRNQSITSLEIPGRPRQEMLTTIGKWDVHMSLSEVLAKVRKQYTAEKGWTEAKPLGISYSWSKFDPTNQEGLTLSVVDSGAMVSVHTYHARNLGWLERAQKSIRGFFGEK